MKSWCRALGRAFVSFDRTSVASVIATDDGLRRARTMVGMDEERARARSSHAPAVVGAYWQLARAIALKVRQGVAAGLALSLVLAVFLLAEEAILINRHADPTSPREIRIRSGWQLNELRVD